MATYRRDVYLPPRQREPIEGRRVGTRTDHEHDQNDAFSARLDWYRKFKELEKSLEKKDERKWFHHVLNFLVLGTAYAVFLILVLKYWVRLL